MTPKWFANRLGAVVAKAGVPGLVTAHSLRIGAATSAARHGYTDSQIKALGRWKSFSFLRYIRNRPEERASAAAGLGNFS